MTSGGRGYDIAIIGMACRVPGARTLEAFWRNLREGVESIVPLSEAELRAAGVPEALSRRPDYVPRAAPLEGMEDFDAGFFGFSPREGAILDPQHRHFMECAWEAIEHAGHRPDRVPGPVGVFAGSGHNAYLPFNLLTHPELLDSVGFFLLRHTGNDKDFLTTRVSHLFDLRGPSVGVQTACSTSLVAVHLACQSLLAGECDLALAGGVTIELPHRQGYVYKEGEILSPDGRCRPFDADAQGTVFGSGAGVVVLRRLTDALANGDRVWAVIRGSAVNNDGSLKAGYLAPSVDGQAQVVAEALAVADVPPETVGFIEAHGTGTPLGDPIEVTGLTQAFGGDGARRRSCALGSVKSNIGHLDTAAGVVGLIKAVLALVHREIPPTLHFKTPNPACALDQSPFYVNAELRPWPSGPAPRRAGVTSLGVGGTNAHIVLEEPPARVPGAAGVPHQALLVSTRSPAALDRCLEGLADHLAAAAAPDLADVAYTLARGRVAMPYRKAIVARDAASAVGALRAAIGRSSRTPVPDRAPEVAFLFPGGGAQHAGMGAELFETEPAYRDALEECLVPLPRHDAQGIRQVLSGSGDPAETAALLERPSIGLPALFANQVALARLWSAWGVSPARLIGHSMGEYTAAYLAGVLTLADAMRLVRYRGELFERLPAGAMLSVTLDAEQLAGLLEPEVSVAAANAPGLSVASGPVAAIARLERRLAETGHESTRLRIATAAHSAMLDPLLPEFRQFVSGLGWSAPTTPIASNLSGQWLTAAEATDPDYWVRHLRHTVRFAEGIGQILRESRMALLEVGPGRTLASLAKAHPACDRNRQVLTTLPHVQDEKGAREHLLGTAAALWELGVPLDSAELFGPGRRLRVPLPTYPFARDRHWIAPAERRAAAPAPAPASGSSQVGLHRVVWQRAASGEGRLPRRALILHDDEPFARSLVAEMSARGVAVVSYVAEADWTDAAGLLERTLGPEPPDAIIDLRTVPTGDALDQARWAIGCGLPGLRALACELSVRMPEWPAELVVVTRGLEDVAGSGEGSAAQAVVAGAVPVIGTEFPHLRCRTVDIGTPAPGSGAMVDQARVLVDELGQPEGRVALRDGLRWLPAFEAVAPAADDTAVSKAGDAFLVTGGTGALGLAVAAELGSAGGVRLALVSRGVWPPRSEWAMVAAGTGPRARALRAILELEQGGNEVELLEADVSRPGDVQRAVVAARARFGHLTGVVHAAGVLRDRLLVDKAPEEMRRVVAPKLLGALALDAALADDPPEWMALFSSVSAVAGLPGQADYAGANAALDAFALRRARTRAGRTVSIAWSAWQDLGMTAVASPYGGRSRSTSLSARADWVLSEHRLVSGEAVLPGTGFLNLAAAAVGVGEEGIELRDVTILAPVIVPPEGSRSLTTAVDDEGRLSIVSTDRPEDEYFTAHLAPIPPACPGRIDVAALRARMHGAEAAASTAEASGAIRFGPHWRNVRAVHPGRAEALLELEQPAAGDAPPEHYPLHPALVDVATAGVQALIPDWEKTHPLFVPVAYGRVRVWRALPSRIVSHVVYRGDGESDGALALFDVTLADPEGVVLADVTPLTLMRVPDPDQLRHPQTIPHGHGSRQVRSPVAAGGLSAADGLASFRRAVMAGSPAHVLVTPGDPSLHIAELKRPHSTAQASAQVPDLTRLAAAVARLPQVSDSALRARRGRSGDPQIAAFVVLRGDLPATVSELRRALREQLPEGPLPQVIVEVDQVPRRADGTVDFDALPDPLGGAEPAVEAPRTPTEQLLAGLWRELLGVETVSLRDNFFDIGGHSLLSIRLISRLHHQTQVRLRHEDIVVNTLEQLAAKLDAGAQTAA